MVFAAERDGCQRVWERNNQEAGRNDKTDHADGVIRRLVGMIILTMLMMMMLVVVLVLIMMMMMMMT